MPDDFDRIAAFIATRQNIPSERAGYLGIELSGIRQDVEKNDVLYFVTRSEGDELIGTFGVDHDAEMGRCWLWGPHIWSEEWDTVADGMFEELVRRLPPSATDMEIAYSSANHHIASFGARNGFKRFSDGTIMLLRRTDLVSSGVSADITTPAPSLAPQLEELHDRLFPDSWLPGRKLLEKGGPHEKLVSVSDEGRLLGYLFVSVEPEQSRGDIEFVGVADAARGRGLGTALIEWGLRFVFSFQEVKEIELFVRSGNPARRIYERLGFEVVFDIIGERRPVAS